MKKMMMIKETRKTHHHPWCQIITHGAIIILYLRGKGERGTLAGRAYLECGVEKR
jgi:hypothetical protein